MRAPPLAVSNRKLFILFIFFREKRPSPKNSGLNPMSFWVLEGVTMWLRGDLQSSRLGRPSLISTLSDHKAHTGLLRNYEIGQTY